jgi:hypothetical protein
MHQTRVTSSALINMPAMSGEIMPPKRPIPIAAAVPMPRILQCLYRTAALRPVSGGHPWHGN